MAVGTRRSDVEIIGDILRSESQGATQLRYSVNLSYPQLQRYLAFLEQSHLVTLERRSTQVISFKVTEKGRRVLRLLDRLFSNLGFNALA